MKRNKKPKHFTGMRKKKQQTPNAAVDSATRHLLQQGWEHQKAGRLAQAETLYRQVLQQQPEHPEALQYLGMLAHQIGKGEAAVDLMRRAIASRPGYMEAYYNLGLMYLLQGKWAEAAATYRRLLEMKPDYIEAHNNLGNALQAQGKPAEAVACYRRALALKPDFTEAHYNLGKALQGLGETDAAVACYRKALSLKPDYLEVHYNLGILLQTVGQQTAAAEAFRRVLTLKPDFAEAYNNLGIVLQAQDKPQEAVANYLRAIDLQPGFAEAYNNLGNALRAIGRLEEAESSFRRALEFKPGYAEAHNNLGILLNESGELDEAVAIYRRAIELQPDFAEAYNNLGITLKDLGELDEAIASFRRALDLRQDYAEAHSNLLFCLNYLPGQSVSQCLDEARNFGTLASSRVSARFSDWRCEANPPRLRVGLVSGDFSNHPVGFFLENMLAHVNSSEIELFAYQANRGQDELTVRLHSRFASWKLLAGLNDEAAARLIHEDGIHVLLDLSGHTRENRLPVFAWKPAPVQATWLGYFATSGIAEMDYIVADPVTVPEAHRNHFTETVWYLPDTRFCFSPPVTGTPLEPSPLPALRKGHITLGCFQKLAKINEEVLATWARVMQLLPQATLRMQDRLFRSVAMRERMQHRLARHGIDPARVRLEKSVPRLEYLAAHAKVDFILDTFPFAGGTTTCEALWMGVPTLTLAGDNMAARQGASLLSCAGLSDWIAADVEDYVTKAVAHAADLEKLSRLRAGLRGQVLASPLFDGPGFAANFEMALWGMWRSLQSR